MRVNKNFTLFSKEVSNSDVISSNVTFVLCVVLVWFGGFFKYVSKNMLDLGKSIWEMDF